MKRQKALTFIIVTLISMNAMTDENSNIDHELLNKYKVDTVISGSYLEAWNKLLESDNSIPALNDYLVSFSEDENDIIIYFTKPRSKPMPGGGNGSVRINKKSGAVTKLKLTK